MAVGLVTSNADVVVKNPEHIAVASVTKSRRCRTRCCCEGAADLG